MLLDAQFWIGLLEILWINILLSGDNAIVIAMACRRLSPRERRLGIILGTIPAILLLIVFTISIAHLMEVPLLKLVGGLLLLWIAYKLLKPDSPGEVEEAHAAATIWSAVRIIVVADIVMSFDNVVAVAAAAHGNHVSLIMGLAFSTPIIMFGSAVVLRLLTRFPLLVNAGAGLLGWIAGDIMVSDPMYEAWVQTNASALEFLAPAGCALAMLLAGPVLVRQSRLPHPRP